MKLIYLIIIAVFTSFQAKSQNTEVLRSEVKSLRGFNNYRTLGSNGVIFYNMAGTTSDRSIRIMRFDADLKQEETIDIPIGKNTLYNFTELSPDKKFLHGLYVTKESFTSFSYNIETRKFNSYSGEFKEKFTPREVYLVEDRIFVSGLVKLTAKLLVLNSATGEHTISNLPNDGKFIKSVSHDVASGKVSIVSHNARSVAKNSSTLTFHNKEGEVIGDPIVLPKDGKHFVINGAVKWLNRTDFILTGSYGVGDFYESGMFFLKFTDGKPGTSVFYPFAELKNFSNYFTDYERDQLKTKNEIVSGQIDNQQVEIVGNHYIIIGKLYRSTTVGDNFPVFSGYSYSQAVVIEVDENGSLIYEGCLKLDPFIKPMTFNKNVYMVSSGKGSTNLYYSDNYLPQVAAINGKSISVPHYEYVETRILSKEPVKHSMYWYDNYFLVAEYKDFDNASDGMVLYKVSVD